MATNAQINVTANTSGAQRAVEAIFKKDYNLNVNIKGGQPLGRITGDLSEFNKSMEAANARVIAFGASASVVYGIQKAFHSLVDSTVEVQKALNQIQVVLNVSNKDITQFGANLFNVAKQTGQSFETVAEAATLLSRQGLGMEETLKRTNDALVLSRITGMDAAKSVQALTAAVNSFTSQAVTASEVVNKFATVDTQFAIGAKDLPEAIGRVGSSAAQAGVSLDQLIALVTATQVATARGGAVIGNSFKTIFTRLDRPKTQALLESLGIGTTDENGKAKGTIELLQSLAGAYEGLSKTQKGQVAEKVGGVFQINILKAALADLNKEYSVYGNALRVSAGATDDAYKRNEALNQTYSAQLNALQLNAKQLSANVGEKLLGPSMSKLIGGANSLLGGINESDSNSVGAKIANGILSGLGQVLSGPGLALIGGVLLKLLVDFTKFAASGTKDLLGLNTATKEQADLQKSITAILSKDPSIYKQIETGAMSVNDVSKALLANLKLQTAELELQSKLSAEIASKVFAGGARVSGGVARVGKASGYIPNFASDEDMEEMHARMLGARNPRAKEGRGTIGGKRFLMNSEEDEIPNFGSNGDSAVIPRYAGGYVPNFAGRPAKRKRPSDISAAEKKEARRDAGPPIDLGFTNAISLIYGRKAGVSDATGTWEDKNTFQKYKLGFHKAGLKLPVNPKEANLEDRLLQSFIDETNNYIKILGSNTSIQNVSQFANTGSVNSMLGNIFETAVNYATGQNFIEREGGQVSGIDFPAPRDELRELFHNAPGQYEAKHNDSQNLTNDVVKKAITAGLVPIPRKSHASGYIPNFVDALHESISREIGAGAPKSGIYVKQYSELAGSDNPMGLGVFNSRDEGSPSKEKGAIRRKGYAAGYVPNFADDSVSSGGGDMRGATTAMSGELLSMVTMMAVGNKGIKKSYDEELDNRRKATAELITENEKELEIKRNAALKAVEDINTWTSLEAEARKSGIAADIEEAEMHVKQNSILKAEYTKEVEALQKVQTSLNQASAKLANPSLSTKASVASGAFGQQAALGLTFLGPILAQTVAAGIDKTTKSGRTDAAVVKGLGDVAAYAGTGAMLGGAPGAVVGALIGSFSALNDVVKEMSTDLPEAMAKTKKASEEKTQTLNQQNTVMPLLEQIQDIRKGAGGVAGTQPEMEIRKKVDEALAGNGTMRANVVASDYNFDNVKNIFIQDATIKADNLKQAQYEQTLTASSEKSKNKDFISFGKDFNTGGVAQLKVGVADKAESLPVLGNVAKLAEAFNYGPFSGTAGARRALNEKQSKASVETGESIGEHIMSSMKTLDEKSLMEKVEEISKAKNLTQLSAVSGSGVSGEELYRLNQSGVKDTDVINGVIDAFGKAVVSARNAVAKAKEFDDEFGPITAILKNNKTALDSALNDFSKSLKIGADQVKFSGEFSRGRSEAKENFYEQTGFLGSAKKLGISNTYNGVMGKAHDENVADIVSSIADVIPHITEGMNMGPSTFSKPEADEKGVRPSVIGATVADFNKAVTSQQEITGGVGGLGDMISDILSKTTATRNVSGLGNVKQYDVEGAVKSFESNPAIAGMKANGDQKEYDKLLSGFKGSVESANDKLIVAQRELATQSAKKVDDLIKATIEGFNRFGGGIQSLLDNSNPNKSGNDVSDAVGKLMLTENSKGASKTDIARQDLSVIKSVNTMMGGIPVFDSNNPIFKGLTTGTQESLTKNLDTAEAKLKQQGPGGKQTVMAMEEELLKTTGAGNRNDALKSIAEFQSVRATGLRTDNTDLGQKMYQKQVDATTARLEKSGPEGKAMAAAYKESSKAGLDPTTDAVLGLKVSYDRIAQSQLDALNKLTAINDKNIESNPENKKYMESNLDPETQSSFDRMNNRAKVKGQIEEQQGGNTPININPSFTINLASNAQNVQAKMPEFEKDVKGVIHKHFGDQMTAATNVAKKDPSLYGAPQTSKQYTA